MTDKALISEFTWRSLEMQRAAYAGMPQYLIPDELAEAMRPTTRQDIPHFYSMSLGCIADKEEGFREFVVALKKCKAWLHTKDEALEVFSPAASMPKLVKAWKEARRAGIQVIGGKISADKRKAESKKATDAIKDRWGMPRKTWPTSVLLEEANKAIGKTGLLTYNTAVKNLGPRPIAQYNYQAKLKRQKLKEERATA